MTSLRAVEQLLDSPGCLTPVLRGFRIDASAMIAQALETSPAILAKWLPAVPVEGCMSGSLFSLRTLLPLEPHFSKLHLVRGRTPIQFRLHREDFQRCCHCQANKALPPESRLNLLLQLVGGLIVAQAQSFLGEIIGNAVCFSKSSVFLTW